MYALLLPAITLPAPNTVYTALIVATAVWVVSAATYQRVSTASYAFLLGHTYCNHSMVVMGLLGGGVDVTRCGQS